MASPVLVTDIVDGYARLNSDIDPSQPTDVSNGLAYNSVRGLLTPIIPNLKPGQSLLDKSLIFQFNPETIEYTKSNGWGNHRRLGHSASIPFWQEGGEKTIQFTLMLDATAGTKYISFGNSASQQQQNAERDNGTYVNYNDAINTNNDQMGCLPQIEILEALQYPLVDNSPIVFANGIPVLTKVNLNYGGNIRVANDLFQNPPMVVFVYGSLHAQGYITSLTRKDKLFNRFLNPIRTEYDVTFTVDEAIIVDNNLTLRPLQAALVERNDSSLIM